MRVTLTCLLLLLLLQSSAAAYTLVMRGGRRVEIAGAFSLSGAQLTYEAAPGVSVTLPLALLDVAATERANNEPTGSFLRRASAARDARAQPTADAKASVATTGQPVRTLTNRELEPARRARVESERAYERRRAELGLPSAEESCLRDEEEERALAERARLKAEEDADAEGHWRGRATALREEAVALDAEINYLRTLLAEYSFNSSVGFPYSPGLAAGALAVITGSRPNFGRRNFNFGRGRLATNVPDAPFFAHNPANALLLNSGGRRRVLAGLSSNGGKRAGFQFGGRGGGKFGGQFPRGRNIGRRSHSFAPGLVGVVGAFDYASADAYELVTRLRQLESERVGIGARWRLMEDEARRAGAQPGWLRP